MSEKNKQGVLITLTGPSLTGKTKLSNLLAATGVAELVSTTTRAMRSGETDGVHYHFTGKDEFRAGIAADDFVEHVEFDGNMYGITKGEAARLLDHGKPAVLVCEPNGMKQIHDYCSRQGWRQLRVFINNPQEILIRRFLERFQGDEKATVERYAKRLQSMMTVERDTWVNPALDGREAYEMVIPEFTPETEAEVVSKVLKAAGITPSPSGKGCFRPK